MLASVENSLEGTVGESPVALKSAVTRLDKKKVKAAGQLSRPVRGQRQMVLKVLGLECI